MSEAIPREPGRTRHWIRPLTEQQLVRAASAGDERAFAVIYERYHQPLYRYCQSILGSIDDAQDALQNTMSKALAAIGDGRGPDQLKPWLYKIAHNESIDLIRRRRDHDRELGDALQDGLPSAAEQAEGRRQLRELIADLRELPERHRGALLMRELGGLTCEEIAASFQTTPGAAKQAIYEARAGLQEISEGRAMHCDEVRRALSDGDGRVVRRRRIRAHVRSCAGCIDFKNAIQTRRAEFNALPILPAVSAASILHGLIGGGGHLGGGGGLIGLFGGLGSTTAKVAAVSTVKVAAVSLATVTIGAGAIEGVRALEAGSDRGNDVARETPSAHSAEASARDAHVTPASDRSARSADATRIGTDQGRSARSPSDGQGNHSSGGRTEDGASEPASSAAAEPSPSSSSSAPASHGSPNGLPPASQFGQQQAASHAPTPPNQATSHPQLPAVPSPPVTVPTLPVSPQSGASTPPPAGPLSDALGILESFSPDKP